MSFSFYINNVPNVGLKATLDTLDIPDLVCDEGIPDSGWPEIAHIYQDNVSVRSIETAFDGVNLQVRIMAHSSVGDFQLACSLVENVASQFDAKIVAEDSDNEDGISLADFIENYGKAWQKEQCLTYLNMLLGMHTSNPDSNMTLFGTRAEFVVGSRLINHFLEDKKTFAKNFFAAFRRKNYLDREALFSPSVISLQHEETGKIAKLSVLVQKAETVLSANVPFLELTNADVLNPGLVEETFRVRFDSFAEAAKEHLVWIDEEIVVTPEFSDEAWESVTSKLSDDVVSDFFADESLLVDAGDEKPVSGSDENSEASANEEVLGFSQEQWGLVAAMPIAVFVMIAGADGEIDQKEFDGFQSQLLVGMVSESELFQMTIVASLSNFEVMIEQMTELGFDGLCKYLELSYDIVKQNHKAKDVKEYGQALYDLAKSVAESSGGGLFGLGSKIGKEEKVVLSVLSSFFELG